MKSFMAFVVPVLLLLANDALAADEKSLAEERLKKAIADPYDDTAFQAYLDALPTVSAPLGSDGQWYLIEGDMPRTAKEVRNYLISLGEKPLGTGATNPELLVHVEGGIPAYWETASRTLRYAVVQSTFGSSERYEKVIKDMADAAQDWEAACDTCGIDFVHVPQQDGMTTWEEFQGALEGDALRSIVVEHNSNGEFTAAAFFPSDPRERRVIYIDPIYFNLEADGETGRGILRHELGHVLGYRHEQIRGIPSCYREDNRWLPLTEYDPHSVMHYYCGGAGTLTRDLSDIDRVGHRTFYSRK